VGGDLNLNDLILSGDISVNQTVDASSANIVNDLTVLGDISANQILDASSANIINGLTVFGDISANQTLDASSVNITNNLTVGGSALSVNNVPVLLAGAGALNGTGGLQGVVSASEEHISGSYPATAAFDGLLPSNTAWITDASTSVISENNTKSIKFVFPTNVIITKYLIWPRNHDASARYLPTHWKLYGNNNVIDEQESQYMIKWSVPDATLNPEHANEYYINTKTACSTFEFIFTGSISNNNSDNQVAIGEIAFYGYNQENGAVDIYNGEFVDIGGDVNISNNLHVSLGIGIGKYKDVEYDLDVSGDIHCTGTLYADSDLKVKKNLIPLDNALDKISKINGYYYHKVGEKDDSMRHVGVIAQEIEAEYPELVSKNTDIKSVNYDGINAILIECVKELYAKNNTLKQEIEIMKILINTHLTK
jgi:hypothetical protein